MSDKLLRIYPLGTYTELSSNPSYYKGKVKETGSGTGTTGKMENLFTSVGGPYDDVVAAGDYIVIKFQKHGLLSVGQWIKIQTVTNTGGSTILTFAADGAKDPTGATVNFYNYLNSSGSSYAGVTEVDVVFEHVGGWGVREFTNDQIDDSIVPGIMNRWGSYTKGTADNDNWRGMLRPLSGTTNTANYELTGTVGERFRTSDAVGAHPVSNTVTITNHSLEQNYGTAPYNGSTNPGHVDDLSSIINFIGEHSAADEQLVILNDVSLKNAIVPRCNAYFTSASNTVGSYQIGSASSDPDSASGTWHSELWYSDNIQPSAGANTNYYLHRKESGAVRGWSGTRSLSNANTLARAANCVTFFSGSNADYVVPGNFPGAATDEAIFFPVYTDNTNIREANSVQTFGHSATLQGTADDAGLHLIWINHLVGPASYDASSSYIGDYYFHSGNSAPGGAVGGTWQFAGNVKDQLTTIGDVIYSQGFEGIYSQGFTAIYSQGFEGIYSGTYSGIYSQGWTGIYSQGYRGAYSGGYTITYGSMAESPNPRTSSEGPTYSGTFSGDYSTGFEGIYSGQYQGGYTGAYTAIYSQGFEGIYSAGFTGIYSNQYTGATVFSTLETETFSLWKRIG